MTFDLSTFWTALFSSDFLRPALTTLGVTLAAMVLGIFVGFFAALAAISRFAVLRGAVRLYLVVFRGVPVLVQIIFWYDGIAEITNGLINLPALVAGTVALGLNEGAYMTEIIRAGLLTVDAGQREAARALGMTNPLALRRIVLPQALRAIIPPTGNQFIAMLKTTSLLFTIAVPEIFAVGTNIYSQNFKYFEILCVVSLWYLLLTGVFTLAQQTIERRFGCVPTSRARPPGPLGRLLGSASPREHG